MFLDSGAKLTKPQCLLITGAVRNDICPGPMGIHTHSCCGKETTSSEATMSLASWAQVQPLPLGKRDLQSPPTCWQSTESSWGISQTSFLEPAFWRTTGSDWVSELCLLSNSNGRVRRRSQGLLQQHSDIHGNYTHSTSGFKTVKGPKSSENSRKYFSTFSWEWLGSSLMVTQKQKKKMNFFSVIPDLIIMNKFYLNIKTKENTVRAAQSQMKWYPSEELVLYYWRYWSRDWEPSVSYYIGEIWDFNPGRGLK